MNILLLCERIGRDALRVKKTGRIISTAISGQPDFKKDNYLSQSSSKHFLQVSHFLLSSYTQLPGPL